MAQIRYTEVLGTSSYDAITGQSDVIYYGLAGDDILTSAANSDAPIFIGGSGNDRYVATTGSGVIIDDYGNSSGDILVAPGMSVASTYFTILDGEHLLIGDISSESVVVILSWQSAASRIETIQFGDGTTYDATLLAATLTSNPHYLGDSTLAAEGLLPAGATTADVIEAINYYRARAATFEAGSPSSGTAGNDSITGSDGNDSLLGLDGNDTVNGAGGNDTLQGNAGADSVLGGTGDDLIFGGRDNDVVQGNQGNDTVAGDLGNDIVRGGQDNDSLYGGQQDDLLAGDLGYDRIYGDRDNDTLYGGQGNDTLSGGDGNDILYGDRDNDELTGGSGSDIFAFSTGSGIDTITDFVHGIDHLQFSSLVFTSQEAAVSAFSGGVMDLGGGNSITLAGITSLDTSDIVIL